jgi:4-hydroxy-tetrahydrodipicolinate synthase
MKKRIRGVVAAAATPVDEHLEPDRGALVEHSRRLLANGCDGLNILGTTGGFASFSVAQRRGVMDALANSDLPLDAMMVGTGGAAFHDTVDLTKRAVERGFAGALVIPPFYYKGVSEDGVFAYFTNLVEAVGANALRLYLYNFPAMSGVAFTPTLVERLLRAFPGIVVGLKDSSNDAVYVAELHRRFPELDVFPSSESVLAAARLAGYAGCISATVNLTSALAARVWNGDADPNGEAQASLAAIRTAISSVPLIPAVHALLGDRYRQAGWSRVPPPLFPLSADERSLLEGRLAKTAYQSDGVVATESSHAGA